MNDDTSLARVLQELTAAYLERSEGAREALLEELLRVISAGFVPAPPVSGPPPGRPVVVQAACPCCRRPLTLALRC